MIGVPFKQLFNKEEKATNLTTGVETIKDELQFLLSIPKHSLFFGNDLGLDLERYLHLLNRQATFNLIKTEIENLFSKYNRVYLVKLDITFRDQDRALLIDITCSTDIEGHNVFTTQMTLED